MTAPVMDEGRAVGIVCSDFRAPFNTTYLNLYREAGEEQAEMGRHWGELTPREHWFYGLIASLVIWMMGQSVPLASLLMIPNRDGPLDKSEGHSALQKWAERNLMKFNMKCTWGVTSWKLSWQKWPTWGCCGLPCWTWAKQLTAHAAEATGGLLSFIRQSIASKWREGILPLNTGDTTPGVLCSVLGCSLWVRLDRVQQRATKMMVGLEYLSHESLRELGFLSLEKGKFREISSICINTWERAQRGQSQAVFTGGQ